MPQKRTQSKRLMKSISILGCGWLGLPLAKSLLEKGFSVKGSTTSLEKIATLENAGIEAFQIEISEGEIKGEIHSFLKNSNILIIDIPPKLRSISGENFIGKIQNLIPFIEKANIYKVIFVSSTSVYADDNSIVSEDTKPQPETESGRQLLEAEQLLQNNKNFRTTVLRFGGLIGDDRHPIHFLAGKQNLENPDAPINLIHQRDCIGILEAIVKQKCWNETFNAVSPFHPTRKEYYTTKAIVLNLALPQFEERKTSIGKIIQSNKVETVLKYKFQNTTL
jgi:nucleoside-diphosphate-sugar epimerase